MAVRKKKIITRTKNLKKTKAARRGGQVGSVVKRAVRKVLLKRQLKAPVKKHQLVRAPHNPIITPSHQDWESRATFNPAAVAYKDNVHVLYRAVGADDRSVLGYASSSDGLSVNHRWPMPVYDQGIPRVPKSLIKIPYSSGGGTSGGCEDPRITVIDDTLYLIYTAFDGWGSLRLALTSITIDDFINHRWNWEHPVMISPPGQIHKNWVLFPEKIQGQYALLHSISPEVQIAYFDSLDHLDGTRFVTSVFRSSAPRKGAWDSWMRGVGPPPLKTNYGWLVLYHAMDFRDPNRYKLGAMILDLNDPSKILYRAQQPILEPDAYYENQGFKSGVIYSCGAVIKEGQLIVYYGGADTVVCVASAKLDEFLGQLVGQGNPRLTIRSK